MHTYILAILKYSRYYILDFIFYISEDFDFDFINLSIVTNINKQ